MGDSAPDPKLEDVLSSVRRLVSQELPQRPVSKPAPAADGALVLTSEDRIKTDPKTRVETRSLEQRIAELEAAVDSTSLEFEPDGSEDQTMHRPDRIVYTRPRSSERSAERIRSTLRLSEIALVDTAPAEESPTREDAKVEFRHGARSREVVPEAPMAEDVPTLPAASAELHAFFDPDDVVARIEARIERGGEPLEQPSAPTRSTPQEPPADDASSFEAELSAAVSASLSPAVARNTYEQADDADTLRIEEVDGDVAAAGAADTPQTDAVIAGPAEATRSAMPERSASETVEATRPAPEAAPQATAETSSSETPESKATAALDALPDEEAMRLLVGRLIREELRGELGERITRNVRKLVRREIMQLLETRSLD